MGDDIDGWPNIHDDILKEIAEHLYSYDDFIQLGLVCKQWSLKLPEISSDILWLLVPEESSSTHIYEDEEIYHLMQLPIADEVPLDIQSLDEDEIHHLKLPEMQNKLIRGSFGGWLIVLDIYQGSMYMLNAFTKVHLDLPPISTFPDIIYYNPNNYGFEYTIRDLDFDDMNDYRGSSSFINSIYVWKVIINSCPSNDNEDFLAVAIYGLRCTLAFYKPNNKRWSDLSTRKPWFHDVIFFGEKIYAVEECGQLYEFDINTKSGPVGGIHEAKPPSDAAVGPYYRLKYYLVGCANGSLLMLARYFLSGSCCTYKFNIYELKKNAKEWSRLDSLENYVLMIGFNSSVQMLPASIQTKGNQIYFTDNLIEWKSPDYAECQDIGIFDLDDGSCQRLLSDVKFMCPPVWCYSSSFL
ncbi:hypothetical protein HN51_035146 [Arachis hypogaea]|uniref:KIB1-4 beta-propeller domain-containing protein n=1 Tax=Arachis hypogaea TaxID=3818 RepID=A0A445A5P0_ARAHY|nr:probable F-box protein At4g22165 [Arachis ipaensis]XP_025637455.1 probable F-box protein At4g22165 [Arachis hypogaea]QHO00131.1 Putative F-box protein [Arachis hypogaea]RYR21739.1 hypothetical protein Ahy_B03g067068 isoform B [Arachis hypogaea]